MEAAIDRCGMDIEGSGDFADGLSSNSMRWRARMR